MYSFRPIDDFAILENLLCRFLYTSIKFPVFCNCFLNYFVLCRQGYIKFAG